MATTLSSILSQMQRAEDVSRAENIKRYGEMMKIYDRIIARSQPGGAFEQRGLAEIERGRIKGVGRETQQLISSGLYGTTTMAGVGRRWEAEVGGPARMTLESMMEEKTTGAEMAKAGAIERREDEYSDYGLIAQLAASAAQQPTTRRQYPTATSISRGTPSVPTGRGYGGYTAPSTTGGYGMTAAERSKQYAAKYPQQQTDVYGGAAQVLEPATPDMYKAEGFDVGQWFGEGGWLTDAPKYGPAGLPVTPEAKKKVSKTRPSAWALQKARAEGKAWAINYKP